MKEIRQKDIPYRNFISKKRITLKTLSKLKKIKPSTCRMPHGKWYSIKHYWLENLELNLNYNKIDYKKISLLKKYKLGNNYFHEVILKCDTFTDIEHKDKNKILVIDSSKDMIKFSKEYCDTIFSEKNAKEYEMNWCKVSNDYAGLEIPRFIKKCHDLANKLTSWYYGWDIPSGVIWNPDVIKSINIIE